MARLTRNSYKRKVILFGVLVFMSIALISTGFAAWVMSTNSKNDDAQGNVTVGVVKDASLTISNVAFISINEDFTFEPLATDNSGRVRFDGAGDKLFEQLEIEVTGKIAPIEFLGKLKVELFIPESVKKAADAGYIVLPDCATWNETINGEVKKQGAVREINGWDVNGTGEWTFTFKIAFEWGTKFGGQNPGVYYDEDPDGILIDDETCKKELQDFRAILYGYEDEMINAGDDLAQRDTVAENHKNDEGPQFKVIITAESN